MQESKILIENNQADVPLDLEFVNAKMQQFMQHLAMTDWQVSVIFVTADVMAHYNQTYRDKAGPTNILAFPLQELTPGKIDATAIELKDLGDLILCPTQVVIDAKEWEVSFESRLERLLAHGLLHLLGYDHHDDHDYAQMKLMEEKLLGYVINE